MPSAAKPVGEGADPPPCWSRVALASSACSDDDVSTTETSLRRANTTEATVTTAPVDPVTAAEARVEAAETGVTAAQDALTAAGEQFCGEPTGYVEALDRYGKLFTDEAATVGDVKTGGDDLVEPRSRSRRRPTTSTRRRRRSARPTQTLRRRPGGAGGGDRDRVERSDQLDDACDDDHDDHRAAGHDRACAAGRGRPGPDRRGDHGRHPAGGGDVEYNSAAFALQIAWLQLLSDAGCLTDEQQAQAVELVTAYTTTLQTELQKVGYYDGEVDGIYGPLTVDAVKQLQTDNDLPETGVVDQATGQALDEQLAELGQQAAAAALTQTAAVQTVLTLTGFWTGPIDGQWTDELTAALMAFQTALGVEPTGAVDAATLAAFEQALAELRAWRRRPPRSSTTPLPTTAPPATTPTIAPPTAASTSAPPTTPG